jgi:hypothetical protein
MYFLSYPIGWPALGHSSEPSLDERVVALTTRLDNATQAQSEALARLEEALEASRSRVEDLSGQLNARTRQLEGIEARLRDNTEALDQQALADERARQARQQNKRAIDALSQTLTDTIDQWDEGAVPATIDDQAVRALAREQARIVGVLQRLTEAEQHLQRLEVDSALKAYEAGLGLLRDQTSRRLQRLADQLEREYQAIQSWPQVDWAGHQRAVIDVGEALRSGLPAPMPPKANRFGHGSRRRPRPWSMCDPVTPRNCPRMNKPPFGRCCLNGCCCWKARSPHAMWPWWAGTPHR